LVEESPAISHSDEDKTTGVVHASAAFGRIPVRQSSTLATTRVVKPSVTTVSFAEQALIERYIASMGITPQDCWRSRSISGETDLEVSLPNAGVRLIETKLGHTIEQIRMAVGQLLHYSFGRSDHLTDLAVLLQRKPDDSVLKFFMTLGITCIYEEPDGSFTEQQADSDRRSALISIVT
jgi:hypothetical protein